ncbi:aspartyl aminopeptidase Aap1 [Schizosaccharomyces cryophilus OY26]|uniref:aspartyl aminopeptidase n=1 Tax=Schizosaccharomyces cryophilus (strain OY26 / ATCC MYA-4695 / CBS 11777 / NBRC 106824 / NRRL Y48691) TaxID=653667 RepID=S9X9H5_SCHCR|nr:aspartyl aminopeptidase Aap1 [Schizosaccharomyces cryophilus OY26]EPY50371.1 aspartyl aminopeptidase Aap1 [Schizosaccharomyces cryophilus OY26]
MQLYGKMTATAKNRALEFLKFVNASPTPYHVVKNLAEYYKSHGFQYLSEKQDFGSLLEAGKSYYVVRNQSSIVAFSVGGKWKPGNGFSIVATHTDSPTLRLKPKSRKSANGYMQVGVEQYGGGIWHSWFDRDLSLAGRVMVEEKDGRIVQHNVHIDRPLLRIPTLAIHLDRTANASFSFNLETEFTPLIGLENELSKEETFENGEKAHHPALLSLISREIGTEVSPESIVDFELILGDYEKARLGGIHEEFVFSPRLDNQGMTFSASRSLISSLSDKSLENDDCIRVVASFDHEEIGSVSAQGAESNLLLSVLERLSGSTENFYRCMRTSFLVSADMAHAVHPNYASKYESINSPELNKGTVLKVNANQRYMTNSHGITILKRAAQLSKAPVQVFVARNDSPCGSTIGPKLAAMTGIPTLDLGNPMLSMHSCREMCGTKDFEYSVQLLSAFFQNFSDMEKKIIVDE